MQLLGLRTTIYPAPDLAAAKTWFTKLLGKEPYFDQPFYVGYNVAGYELGLDPNADPALGAQAYWGVPDAQIAVDELVAQGATIVRALTYFAHLRCDTHLHEHYKGKSEAEQSS